jgi:tetratricopeptide (TPR) repeat protein
VLALSARETEWPSEALRLHDASPGVTTGSGAGSLATGSRTVWGVSDERSRRRIENSNEVIARIASDTSDLMRRRELALALMDKALALDALGRYDEVLAICDRVVAHFGGDDDAEIARRVGWAFVDKAIALEHLDRPADAVVEYDEALRRIAAMADAPEALLVAALLNKSDALRTLKRHEEALEACSVAVRQCADAAHGDPDRRNRLAWALMKTARTHRDAGEQDAAVAVYDEVLERFDGDDDARVRRRVGWALVRKADLLYAGGRHEAALQSADALLGRVGESTDHRDRRCVHAALRVKGDALRCLGREAEAVVIYASAIALADQLADGLADREYVEWSARDLLETANALSGLGRGEQEVAARDAAFALLEPPAPAWLHELLGRALVFQTVALENLGEAERAAQVPNTARALLGGPVEADDAPEGTRPCDARLAELLAETLASDCFEHFASRAQDRPRETYAARAVALYRETLPVLIGLPQADEEHDAPATHAIMALRSIADGYALLSRDRPINDSDASALPSPARMAVAVSTSGLDQWAEDHGHPLPPLAADEAQALDSIRQPREAPDASEADLEAFARSFVNKLRVYDMIAAIRSARGGRDVLRGATMRDDAMDYFEDCLRWINWLPQREPDAIMAGLAMLLIAQSWHVAAWTERPLHDEWFPSRAFLREFVAAPDGLSRLAEEGVELPGWMQ